VKQFLLQGLGVTVVGCVAGWGLALASSRMLSGIALTVCRLLTWSLLSSVVLVVLLVAAIASLVPAVAPPASIPCKCYARSDAAHPKPINHPSALNFCGSILYTLASRRAFARDDVLAEIFLGETVDVLVGALLRDSTTLPRISR